MPQIRKQVVRPTDKPSSNGKAEPASSVLDRIAPVRDADVNALKASFYGLPKTGKTRVVCTFPKPLLLIGYEDGTASVAGVPGVDFVLLRNTDEMRELIDGPIADGKYASVGLDNATKMREMHITELFASRGMKVPERKPFLYAGQVWKDVWNQCSQDMKDMLTPLFDAQRELRFNLAIVAQEQTFGAKEDKDGEEAVVTDVIKPAIGSALGKGLCMWLNAECDYVCQTFIRKGTADKPIYSGTGAARKLVRTDKVETGKMEYCLRVGPHDIYVTGFRVPLGNPPPPDVIVDPSYEKIAAIVRGENLG